MPDTAVPPDAAGRLLRRINEAGFTAAVSCGAGAMHALASTQAFLKPLWPHRNLISSVWGSSAGSISAAFFCSGLDPVRMENLFRSTRLKNMVGPKTLSTVNLALRGLQRAFGKRAGIVNGDHFRFLIRSTITPERDRFSMSFPRFSILATPSNKDHGGKATVFSPDSTPETTISSAVVASSAHPVYFGPQWIDGVAYSDAARLEPLPTTSIIQARKNGGSDPKELVILAHMITYNWDPPPDDESLSRKLLHYIRDNVRVLITNQLRCAIAEGAAIILIQPNVDNLRVPEPMSRSRAKNFLKEIDVELFPLYYPYFDRIVPRLYDAAADAFLANPSEKFIVSTNDKENNPSITLGRNIFSY